MAPPPSLLQIAIAAYRHGRDDDDSDAEGGLGGLAAAPGGPSKFELADVEARSPVAGLFARLERLLAKQASRHCGQGVQ